MKVQSELLNRLREKIARDGPLSVATYMRLCLTDPDNGYYTTSQSIGRDGDFITAPEVSQVFGELIGLFFADYWHRSGSPQSVRLIELGPGRGTLMADLLRAAKTLPGFAGSLDVDLVEVSWTLRREQRKSLETSGHLPSWHDSIESIPDDKPTFLVANEFFDALPVKQYVRKGTGWHDRLITWDPAGGRLAFTTSAARQRGDIASIDAQDGDVIEGCPDAGDIAAHIGRRIVRNGGVALFIDYGYEGPAVGDTLQAVRAHRYADPLDDPGQVDLTAHVDFTPLKSAADEVGAVAWGPVAQGTFLRRLGLEERLAVLAANKSKEVQSSLRVAAERLAGSRQMGRLFKAVALTSPTGPEPSGFQFAEAVRDESMP